MKYLIYRGKEVTYVVTPEKKMEFIEQMFDFGVDFDTLEYEEVDSDFVTIEH